MLCTPLDWALRSSNCPEFLRRILSVSSGLVRTLSMSSGWYQVAQNSVSSVTLPILFLQLGFTLGNVVGMYLAQNYDIPNLAKKLEEIKKDVDAKKKPPSCWSQLQHCLLDKLSLLLSRASFTIWTKIFCFNLQPLQFSFSLDLALPHSTKGARS